MSNKRKKVLCYGSLIFDNGNALSSFKKYCELKLNEQIDDMKVTITNEFVKVINSDGLIMTAHWVDLEEFQIQKYVSYQDNKYSNDLYNNIHKASCYDICYFVDEINKLIFENINEFESYAKENGCNTVEIANEGFYAIDFEDKKVILADKIVYNFKEWKTIIKKFSYKFYNKLRKEDVKEEILCQIA